MKAIVLLSGGIDSAVVLAKAIDAGKLCLALSFDYGQRHLCELLFAKALIEHYNVFHKTIHIDPKTFDHSSLVYDGQVPKGRTTDQISSSGIPNTYVPGRNTLFLAYAIGQAEIHNAKEIHFGPNALDHTGYPDCRPEYVQAVQQVIQLATKDAVENTPPQLITPIIHLNKKQIFQEGAKLGVPFNKTMSCYDPTDDHTHCGECDACTLRKDGFLTANIEDPTRYSKLGSSFAQ